MAFRSTAARRLRGLNGYSTRSRRSGYAKLKQLQGVADELHCSMAQLGLAWCLKSPVSTVITGASRPAQVTENMRALDVVPKLTPEVMARLDAILDNTPDAGCAQPVACRERRSAGHESSSRQAMGILAARGMLEITRSPRRQCARRRGNETCARPGHRSGCGRYGAA